MNTDKRDEENHQCKGVEEKQVEPGTAPEDADSSIANVLQQVIADIIKQQVEIPLFGNHRTLWRAC